MSDILRKWAILSALLVAANTVSAQTILIVTRETLDGEIAPRPFSSQEGFMSAMFDFGYVSFDTGPYEPQVGWEAGRYEEPLAIAASGLADYLVVARIDSNATGAAGTTDSQASGEQPLEVKSRVRFELLEVSNGRSLGHGEFSLGSAQVDSRQSPDYRQAMFQVGGALARECRRLLVETPGQP